MAFENLKSTGIKYILEKLKSVFVMAKDAVKSVNGNLPDEYGEITLSTVPFAQNLESESNNRTEGTFVIRTAGGDSSIKDGEASLMSILGNNTHTGYVPESIQMTVNSADVTATINRDDFVSAVAGSGITVFTYTVEWSLDPSDYGITVSGTPENGDTITVVYVEEERGTISVTTPTSFTSTGWNLYKHSAGYAKVTKYSYGYRISGAYTVLQFSETLNGTKTGITVNNGAFDIPADGYVWVTGGNDTTTAIWATWNDWASEYEGDFEAYQETVIDFSSVMSSAFPYGLMKAVNVADEIDFNVGKAYQRVDRMAYSAENIQAAKASGLQYEYDENFIYIAKSTAVSVDISITSVFDADDHGIEYFEGTDIGARAQIVYGGNLKNKLERDVLTISQQTLTEDQKTQVRNNIGAVGANAFSEFAGEFVPKIVGTLSGANVSSYCVQIGHIVLCDIRHDGATSTNMYTGLPKAKYFARSPIVALGDATKCGVLLIDAGTTDLRFIQGSGGSAAKYGQLVYITEE